MGTKRDIRTKGAESQWDFDCLISDESISGLTHLGSIYDDRIVEYKTSHDLNNPEYFSEYQNLKQRRKMITEELENRIEWQRLSPPDDVHFNDAYDIVIEEDNGEIRLLRPSLNNMGQIEIIELEEEDVRK